MVRRSAAVLSGALGRRPPAAALLGLAIALGLAQTYVLVVTQLPTIASEDRSIVIAWTAAAAAIYLCLAALVPISDDPQALGVVAAVGVVLVVAFAVADLGAAATPVEAVTYGALGALLAMGLLAPPMTLGLPLFVALIDLVSTLGGGLSEHLANAGITKPGDPLSLEVPDWGNGLPAGRIGFSDAVFAGAFLLYARRLDMRPRATALGMGLVTVLAIVLRLWLDRAIPVLPLFAVVYYGVNGDRLRTVLAAARRG